MKYLYAILGSGLVISFNTLLVVMNINIARTYDTTNPSLLVIAFIGVFGSMAMTLLVLIWRFTLRGTLS